MSDPRLAKLQKGLTRLDDEWLRLTEHSAFVCEAYTRLLADHPNIDSEVIQGAESQARQLTRQWRSFGHKLNTMRQSLKE